MTLLGTWTTWFPISDHNYYGANIWIPAQIINGTVLAPGQHLRLVERGRRRHDRPAASDPAA